MNAAKILDRAEILDLRNRLGEVWWAHQQFTETLRDCLPESCDSNHPAGQALADWTDTIKRLCGIEDGVS